MAYRIEDIDWGSMPNTTISKAKFLENVSRDEWTDFIYDCVNCEPDDIAIIWDN